MTAEPESQLPAEDPSDLPGPGGPHLRTRGRPTRLTKEVHHLMVSAVGRGATFKDAAAAAGIALATAHEWVARGEGADPDRPPAPIFVEFARDIRRAAATARVIASARLFETNPAKWLAHVDPGAWGRDGVVHQEPPSQPTKEDQL